jgi:hypothetical protein
LDKQISVEIKDKTTGLDKRLDIGEVQVVNPFGTDAGGFLGNTGQRNLKINTSLKDDTISYTAESDILRLGLDLDGIAAFLATGESFTRVEEEIGVNPFDPTEPFAEIVADLIDIKYGPELGYRETVEVKTDFNVTLSFKNTDGSAASVALDDDGTLSIGETWTGKWSELPEIAILGTDDVEVEVDFLEVTGSQTKRGAFYLTDYLQLTLLELESLNILDLVDLSLPPVYQGRTSVLGALLGEVELEVTNLTEAIAPFAVSPTLAGGAQFTLNAAPTVLVYSANGDGGLLSASPGSWRRLADGTTPTSLAGTTIYVGFDNMAQAIMSTGDTDTMTLLDAGGSIAGGTATIDADAIQVPTNSVLRQIAGQRIWDISRIANDGTIESFGYTQFGDGTSGILQIIGDGTIVSSFGEMSFQPNTLIHGPGHTIRFEHHQEVVHADSGPFHFLSNLVNAGTIHYLASEENSSVAISNSATGVIKATDGSLVEFFNGSMTNHGLILADTGSEIRINQSGNDTLLAPGGEGVFRADNGSKILFKGSIQLGDANNSDADLASRFRFEVGAGSEIDFEGEVRQVIGSLAEHTDYLIAEGGTLRMNGIRFPDSGGPSDPRPTQYSSFIDVVNHGTLILESGRNYLQFDPDDAQAPGVPPSPPRPVVAALNLVNEGEIVIQDDAVFGFEVEIKDYSEGGATLADGEWTLEGEVPTSLFSNTQSFDPRFDALDGRAVLDISVVQVSNSENILSLTEFEDTNGDGVVNADDDGFDIATFDTDLSINATTVTLSGKALFPYFNTVEQNEGTINLRHYQNFSTAGDLINTGTINIASNARLDVQGKLTVGLGGVVNVAATTLGANQLLEFDTLEILGGEVNTNAQAMLNEGLFGIRVDGYLLNAGVSIIVREDTAFAEEGEEPTTTPGLLNMVDSPGLGGIARSNGTIVMDGAGAVFDLARHMQYNHGTLEIRNGHVWQSTRDDFRNAPGATMLLQAGQFLVDGTFRNEGDLTVDAESYLKAQSFTNNVGGTLRLDGVVEADSIRVDPQSTLTGTGRFSGSIDVSGTFAPGNSAGLFTIFSDLTMVQVGTMELELAGNVAGESYDQVLVDGLASYAGQLSLVFLEGFSAPSGQEWLLVEAEQSAGTFDSILTSGLDTPVGSAPGPRFDAGDMLVGQYEGQWLYLTYYGGDGNDLSLYAALLPGDTDGDGDVDDADLGTTFSNYTGPLAAGVGTKAAADGDTDGDGDVDDADLGAAFAGYTGPIAPTNIPEPSSVLLLGIGGVALARRRRVRIACGG